MKLKGIKIIGPFLDNSGYGRASRGNIIALHKLGVPLTLSPISFENIRPDLGEHGKIIDSLVGKDIDYNVCYTHTTPEFWEKHYEPNKLNLNFTIWETTELHPSWPGYINNFSDGCMVGCDWNVDVFRDSGVTVPLFNVPHCVSVEDFKTAEPFELSGIGKDTFVFYSIFQFTERKNPCALIKAYWRAFTNCENVALVLKTYRSDYSEQEKDAIRTTIQRLKAVTPMENYPPIYFVSHMLSEDEIMGLHLRGDCYVSLDRGEGFGMSPAIAGAIGKPIIVTGFGGVTEYAKPDNSYLVDYLLTPVHGMPWCMSLKSLVKTTDGYLRAKDLKEGMFVENKNLNNKVINKVEFRSILPKEIVYSLKHFSMPEEIELTSTHKLYVVTEEGATILKKVEDINVGDYLYVPKPKITYSYDFLDLKGIPNEKFIASDSLSMEQVVNNLKNLFYLFGLYLAEGYVEKNNRYVSFSFNSNEGDTLGKFCKKTIKNIFDINEDNIYERYMEDRNGYEITFNNKDIASIFRSFFGSGSHTKSIPNTLKYNELNYMLLRGYWDGDGHIRKEGYKNKALGKKRITPECTASTASYTLALDLRDILLSLNIIPSLYKNERKDGRISYIFSISCSNFDKIFGIDAKRINSRFKKEIPGGYGVLITKKELLDDFDDLICSISIETDKDEDVINGGSYILNGIASSNSPWYRGTQSWAEPGVLHGAELMKHVYENQDEARGRGLKLQQNLKDNFSYEAIGQKIIDAAESLL